MSSTPKPRSFDRLSDWASTVRRFSQAVCNVPAHAGMAAVRGAIVEACANAFGTRSVALYTIDSQTGEMDCESGHELSPVVTKAFLDLCSGQITDRAHRAPWVLDIQASAPAGPSERILSSSRVSRILACPVRSDLNACGAIAVFYADREVLPAQADMLIEIVAAQASLALSYVLAIEQSGSIVDDLAVANTELSRQATQDGLTGLANHRCFQQKLAELCARLASHPDKSFALVMMDVDHFKQLNDSRGHQAGDMVLQDMASLFGLGLRRGDLAARYGGEEFAIILQHTDGDSAYAMAERIRTAIAEQDHRGFSVTVSMGIAEYPAHATTPSQLIACADRALYRAKNTGRNRVCTWSDGAAADADQRIASATL